MAPTEPGEPAAEPDLAALGEAVRRAEDDNAEGRPAAARRRLRPVLSALADAGDEAPVVRLRAWALMELARSEHETRGEADRTLAQLDAMVAHQREHGAASWSGLAPAVAGLHGLLALRSGRLTEALPWLDEAVAHLDEAEPLDACRCLLNRGVVHAERRELAAAAADYAECARRARQAGYARLQFKAEHNLGHLAFYAGRLPEALARMEAAAATAPARRPIALLDRGLVLLEAGLVAEADATLAEAADLFTAQHLPHDVGRCELGRAECALVRADPAAARRHAAAAHRLFQRRGDEAWAVRAAQLMLTAEAGELAALPADTSGLAQRWATLSSRATRLAVVDGGADRPLAVLGALTTRIEADLARGACPDPQACLAAVADVPAEASIATRLGVQRVRALLHLAAGRRTAAVREVRSAQRELRLHRARFGSLDMRTAGAVHGTALADLDVELALTTGRASTVFDAAERARAVMAGSPHVMPPADPVAAELLAQLRQVVSEHPDVLGRPVGDPERERVVAEIARLRRDVLARSWHLPGRAADDRAARAVDVRRALEGRPGAALLDLVEHRGRLLAVRVEPSATRLADLGDAAPVREDVRRVLADLEMLANPLVPTALRAVASGSLRTGLGALAAAVAPVLAPDDDEVVVVGGGWLGLLPWGLLPTRTARPTVVAPSVRHWLVHAEEAVPYAGLTAVAGPGLAAAEGEVRQVAALWPEGHALVGAGASVAAVTSLLGSPGMLHLAAHGRHEPDNPLFSSVRLADGPLFAHELDVGGRVPGLVVLSCCEVGRSSVRAGGEALGLASVLLRTGVGSVVAATAPLLDSSAPAVMTRLHGLLREGRPLAGALALAAAEHVDETGDPVPLTCLGASPTVGAAASVPAPPASPASPAAA